MSASLSLDSAGFQRAVRGLAQFSGAAIKQVIRAEAGSILKACAGDTKVATQQETDLRARVRAIRDLELTGGRRNSDATISVNAGLRGAYGRVFKRKRDGTGWRRTHEAGFRPINQHYRRGDWIDLQEAIATVKSAVTRALPLARASVGLARQSWVQIGDDIGIRLEDVPGGRLSASGLAKARAALASNGRAYVNGMGEEFAAAQSYFVQLTNRLPYAQRIGLDSILVKNVNARVRFFQRNVETGVFDALNKTARAYPGLALNRLN